MAGINLGEALEWLLTGKRTTWPRWLMAEWHMDPDEAVEVFKRMGGPASRSLALDAP